MIELIDQIRREVECCCSWTRYEAIILLLNQMEEELINEAKRETRQEVNIFTSEKEAEKNENIN